MQLCAIDDWAGDELLIHFSALLLLRAPARNQGRGRINTDKRFFRPIILVSSRAPNFPIVFLLVHFFSSLRATLTLFLVPTNACTCTTPQALRLWACGRRIEGSAVHPVGEPVGAGARPGQEQVAASTRRHQWKAVDVHVLRFSRKKTRWYREYYLGWDELFPACQR